MAYFGFRDNPDAAASSRSQVKVPSVGRTPTAGLSSTVGLPSSTSRTGATLLAPATRNRTLRAALIVGKVNVTRSTGGGNNPGGGAVSQVSATCNDGLPGKSDAVWPSSPRPRRTRSKRGGGPFGSTPKKRASVAAEASAAAAGL